MMAVARPDRRPARVRVPRRVLERDLRALGQQRVRRMRRSARGLIDVLGTFAARGTTPLGAAIGPDTPRAWQQYALEHARMRRAGALFFYYHSHARGTRSEHGHFHVFRSLAPCADAGAPARYAHFIAIGVDARGLPLRLFTTNRWVTDECWCGARDSIAALERTLAARAGRAVPLERFLRGVLTVFFPQAAMLLVRRDQRVAEHGGARVLEDRRMHVLSECTVSLAAQMAALDDVSD